MGSFFNFCWSSHLKTQYSLRQSLKGIRICHPPICHWGIKVILRWRQFRIDRCVNSSLSAHSLPNEGRSFSFAKVSPLLSSPGPCQKKSSSCHQRQGNQHGEELAHTDLLNNSSLPLALPYFLVAPAQVIGLWSPAPPSFVKRAISPWFIHLEFHLFSVNFYEHKINF